MAMHEAGNRFEDDQRNDDFLGPAAALDALEAFIVGNEDLAQLEERIGRFNIFDALGIVQAELRHSTFLAWLLDPAESHAAGQLFLRAVLMDMLAKAPRALRPCSPVALDGLDLGQVELYRERDHIDILVLIEEPKLVFAIENKVYSNEHSDQLDRYQNIVERRYPKHTPLMVYLTRHGEQPSNASWASYSYAHMYETLSHVCRLNAGSMGEDVKLFLDHYLRVIGSRFMEDPGIDELCARIYKNHRQALDLIFDRRPDARKRLATVFADQLEDDDYWVLSRASLTCEFMPTAWRDIVPPIAKTGKLGPNALIRCSIWIGHNRANTYVYLTPTTDPDVRAELLEAIRASGSDAGFQVSRTKSGTEWSTVWQARIASSKDGFDVDESTEHKFRTAARRMREITERMTPFLERHFGKA